MKTLVLSALLFSTCFALFGQAPGYLGKKAILNFNVSSSIAISGPTQNNRGSEAFGVPAGGYGINYELEGSFSYVIGRYSSLELTASQYYTGMASEATTTAIPEDVLFGNRDNHELFHRLNVKSISLTHSRFLSHKGALAPVGSRVFYGLKMNAVKGSILDKRTSFYNSSFGEVLGHEPLNINQETRIFYGVLGWSKTRIFWDKLVFTTGFRIAIPLSSDLSNYFNRVVSNHPDYFSDRNKAEFETRVSKRIDFHEVFRFNIGVGYLLF